MSFPAPVSIDMLSLTIVKVPERAGAFLSCEDVLQDWAQGLKDGEEEELAANEEDKGRGTHGTEADGRLKRGRTNKECNLIDQGSQPRCPRMIERWVSGVHPHHANAIRSGVANVEAYPFSTLHSLSRSISCYSHSLLAVPTAPPMTALKRARRRRSGTRIRDAMLAGDEERVRAVDHRGEHPACDSGLKPSNARKLTIEDVIN